MKFRFAGIAIAAGFLLMSGQATAANGQATYDATCAACHASGAAGAPKLSDKAAWMPRLQAGITALTASALKGKGIMPAKGGNSGLRDADVAAAVEYMVSKVK